MVVYEFVTGVKEMLQKWFQYCYIANWKLWSVLVHYLSLSLALLIAASPLVSLPVNADDPKSVPSVSAEPVVLDGDSETVDYETGRQPDDLVETEGNKDPQEEIAAMTGEPELAEAKSENADRDKEEVWIEISQAISGLNDMVGDKMFRDLRRTSESQMEVRVDLRFWQRVRYETRVDLKNDISNIWHLYVQQYSEEDQSAVYFIDDQTNKTIDIFSQFQ